MTDTYTQARPITPDDFTCLKNECRFKSAPIQVPVYKYDHQQGKLQKSSQIYNALINFTGNFNRIENKFGFVLSIFNPLNARFEQHFGSMEFFYDRQLQKIELCVDGLKKINQVFDIQSSEVNGSKKSIKFKVNKIFEFYSLEEFVIEEDKVTLTLYHHAFRQSFLAEFYPITETESIGTINTKPYQV